MLQIVAAAAAQKLSPLASAAMAKSRRFYEQVGDNGDKKNREKFSLSSSDRP
ncbi:MAG: hypothetical protein ABI690_06920 [Chloroflexota bacterium]